MGHTFHCNLRKSLRWYHNWHNHPYHQHAHWSFFLIITLSIFSFLSAQIKVVEANDVTGSINGNACSFTVTCTSTQLPGETGACMYGEYNGSTIFNPQQSCNPGSPGTTNTQTSGNLVGPGSGFCNDLTGTTWNFSMGSCNTPTPTPTPSGNPTPTPTPTPSGNPTPTPNPNPTPTPSGNPTPSGTPCVVNGQVVPGYIVYGEANASIADFAQSGYFCDDDAPFVSVSSFPISGLLYCTGSATAFITTDGPCNCRPRDNTGCHYDPNQPFDQYRNNPGWYFSNGQPVNVNIIASNNNCSVGQPFTLNSDSGISIGAYHNRLAGSGFACIPGSTGTPAPTPIPRYIYYLTPSAVQAGQTMIISGQNLSPTVTFSNSSGNVAQVNGTLNPNSTTVGLTTPPNLSPGLYDVHVGPNPDSNKVGLTILTGQYQPSLTSIQAPIITLIAPLVISPGDTLQIMGDDLTPIVQFIDVNGVVTTVVGTVSIDYRTTTVTIPSNLAGGIYTVGIASQYGVATSADLLTVISNNIPLTAAAAPQQTPPATQFQDLISNAFNYSLIVVGIAVFIMIMWGGFLWLTSAANPGNIATAKRYIFNAILGAILLISAYVILYTINPELVGGSFNLPGISSAPVPLPSVPPPPPSVQCSNPASLATQYNVPYPRRVSGSLAQLVTCIESDPTVASLIDRNQIFTYEITNDLCNYTRGNPVCGTCAHSVNSCHYGGSTGSNGAEAVDYNASNSSQSGEQQLYNAINNLRASCSIGYILFEQTGSGWHTHVSTSSCSGN